MKETINSNDTLQVLKQSELCGRQFTVYGTAENPLFLAKEVAEVINHSNPRSMVGMVDDEEKVVNNVYTLGGNQETWFLTEDGLYEVLMQSRKPIAKEFKKGVKTILKEIRTKGGYLASREDESPEVIMARALQIAQETINRNKALLQAKEAEVTQLQEERASLQPLADYTREVLQSTDTYTLTQVAKALGYKSAIQLTRVLRDKGILYKQSGTWMPKSKYSGEVLGYFKTRTHRFFRSDGSVGTSHITVVTERGVSFLHSILK